jgi:hypothetical protein
MTSTLTARDIYLRHTDKDGESHVQEHRVWDAERFLSSQQAAASKEKGSVQLSTREVYLKERNRK